MPSKENNHLGPTITTTTTTRTTATNIFVQKHTTPFKDLYKTINNIVMNRRILVTGLFLAIFQLAFAFVSNNYYWKQLGLFQNYNFNKNDIRNNFDHQDDKRFTKLESTSSSSWSEVRGTTSTLLGGDFAGLAATFSPETGELIPIPSEFIPEALQEWGQEPSALEILVSEDLDNEILTRTTLTVLPDTGCGVDNLDTIKGRDAIDLLTAQFEGSNVVALQYGLSDEVLRLETLFPMDDAFEHRIRVTLDIEPGDAYYTIQPSMMIATERRTSLYSTKGNRADQGGLDSYTVSQLLGDKIRQTPTFAENVPAEAFEKDGIMAVTLPAGVSIAYGWASDQEWVLQVGHVMNGQRRVVSRRFELIDEELNYEVESWTEEAST